MPRFREWAPSLTPAQILARTKAALRNGPYTWPGGYPTYFVMADGEALSHRAARMHWRSIVWTTLTKNNKEWEVIGVEINWEDPALFCADSGDRIESAYAED